MENHTNDHKNEDGLFKGLFFGILLGVGLVYLLNSKTGKQLVEKAKEKIDEALSEDLEGGEYEEVVDENVAPAPVESSAPAATETNEETAEPVEPPHRFFQNKEE
jgi:hypothetical protein